MPFKGPLWTLSSARSTTKMRKITRRKSKASGSSESMGSIEIVRRNTQIIAGLPVSRPVLTEINFGNFVLVFFLRVGPQKQFNSRQYARIV